VGLTDRFAWLDFLVLTRGAALACCSRS
jgi:hypothetical protein